ncbi:LOW QUALITY PROTEIN: hypothetical protein LguiB_010241 [Lonicera macranthoides]
MSTAYQWCWGENCCGLKALAIITAIDLSRNKLTGEFPEEITNLEALILLNLSSNQLYGVIPPKIGNMKFLEVLDLSRNKFSGEIPPAMDSALDFGNLCHIIFMQVLNSLMGLCRLLEVISQVALASPPT